MEEFYVRVAYWTAQDDRDGNCAPSGCKDIYVKGNSWRDVEAKVEKQKRFQRSNGESRIYDISSNR